MFGLMVYIGLKFLSAPTLSRGITLGSRSRTKNFHKSFFCVYVYIAIPLRNFIYILHVGRYSSRV